VGNVNELAVNKYLHLALRIYLLQILKEKQYAGIIICERLTQDTVYWRFNRNRV